MGAQGKNKGVFGIGASVPRHETGEEMEAGIEGISELIGVGAEFNSAIVAPEGFAGPQLKTFAPRAGSVSAMVVLRGVGISILTSTSAEQTESERDLNRRPPRYFPPNASTSSESRFGFLL